MDEREHRGVTWDGQVCVMCKGRGVAQFRPSESPATWYWHTCPACNGHGREPS
jgi:DnaJ-class molecular chaperone